MFQVEPEGGKRLMFQFKALMAQVVENLPECRRPRFNPQVGKIPGKGNGNPFQYSCLENSMDREALWAIVHEVAKSRDKTEGLTEDLHPV